LSIVEPWGMASGSFGRTARIWRLPEHLHDLDPERVRLGVLLAVGAQMRETGGVEPLSWSQWQHS